jgi:hypothetical protein
MERVCCPRCNQVIIPPVWQCLKGHKLCNYCNKSTSACPTCSIELKHPDRDTNLEDVIRDSSDLPCKNKNIGCDYSGRIHELVQHQQICEYDDFLVSCFFCKDTIWQGKKRFLVSHLIQAHNTDLPVTIHTHFAIELWKTSQDIESWQTSQWKPRLYRREIENTERFYMFNAYVKDNVLRAGVWSISHDPEAVKIVLKLRESEEEGPIQIFLGKTLSLHSYSGPMFTMAFDCFFQHFTYNTLEKDEKSQDQQSKTFLFCVQFGNSDFYTIP